MKRKLLMMAILAVVMVNSAFSQDKHWYVKLNFGGTFSKAGDDLASATYGGHALQPSLGAEVPVLQLNYVPTQRVGVRLAGTAGYDLANFNASDMSTTLKITIPSIGGRIYPIASYDNTMTVMDSWLDSNSDYFFGEGTLIFLSALVVNSLHFDYGVGFGNILETAYIDENFQDETVKRTMIYKGWGLQPELFNSENGGFTLNAFFDFGKYKWENANGGTSSIKYSFLGFGTLLRF